MIKIKRIKELYKQLRENIQKVFLKVISYYNTKRSIELTLKKRDKVYLLRKNIKTKRLSDKLNNKKLRLFEIKEVKRLVNYKLRLLKSINIYLVFYILLLKLIPLRVLKALTTEIKLVNLEEEYEVK
jgi:ribosomal protein L11